MTMIYYSRKIFLLDRDFHFQTHEVYEMCLNSYIKRTIDDTYDFFAPRIFSFFVSTQACFLVKWTLS